MGKDIKKIVAYYSKLYKTNNPFELADCLNIEVFKLPLGSMLGYYIYMKRHRCIFINSDIEDGILRNIVMAHELGHATMHRNDNCYFISNKTLLLTSKIERQANKFAAELLINDNMLKDYEGYTIEQFSKITGFNEELIKLKFL